MTRAAEDFEVRGAALGSALSAVCTPLDTGSALLTDCVRWAREALQAGRADIAVELLENLVVAAGDSPAAWSLLGYAYGAEQRLAEATHAFARAAALEPTDAATAVSHAQASLDAGYPATALFARALHVAPDNLAATAGLAAALADEGRTTEAESLLADRLQRQPDWLSGHKQLADLRWTMGNSGGFAASYAPACVAQPRNLSLRLAWFGAVARTQDWEGALKIIADGEALIGTHATFIAARAHLASESGNRLQAEQLFERAGAGHDGDPGLGIARIRHCLRTSQWEQAQRIALGLLGGAAAPMIWPYLSLIWRLQGDRRAQWLDGSPPYIRCFDLPLSVDELRALAACLRRLHTVRAPFPEQSVREGTQTDTSRQLFFRSEPELQRVRASACEAIRDYVAGLPPMEAGHPLLGARRDRIRFSGSWSVRLHRRGFHVSHTHPQGWISSALYVSIPEPARLGPAPAGWTRFGSPPASLGLPLSAYQEVEARPGRLVLFPSTLWHETVPFDDGERLVIAFDVARQAPG